MKKAITKSSKVSDGEMRPEYDFRGVVRGKDYRPLEKGYTIYIHQLDGTTVVKHMKLDKGFVRLRPEVSEYFPDSAAVNSALRSLIALMSQMPSKKEAQNKKARGDKRRLAASNRST